MFSLCFVTDCPLNVDTPALPSSLSCHLEDYCTGVQCCLDVNTIGKSFTTYVFLNACEFKLEIGIEKFSLNISLLTYPWGKMEEFSLFGVLRVRYCRNYWCFLLK